jgi:hypothetical protein
MVTIFEPQTVAPDFRRYRAQWESALLSLTMFENAGSSDNNRRDLCRDWFAGLFNGHAAHVLEGPEDGLRSLEWHSVGPDQFDLIYTAPYGMQCSLGRVYRQPNGTWGALVVAGVKDDPHAAMAAAEWAVSRLCS